MKLYSKFTLLAMTIVAFAACNKDDDSTAADNLPGTWKMTDIHTEDGTSIITIQGIPLSLDYSSMGISYNTTSTFTENPNEYTSEGTYVARTTIATPGTPTVRDETIDAFPETGTWSIKDDTLTQVLSGQTMVSEILELSKSKMQLKQNVDFSYNAEGLLFQTTAILFTTFEKQ